MKTTMRNLLLPAATITLAAVLGGAPAYGAGGYSFGEAEGKNGNCLDCHSVRTRVGDKSFIDPVRYRHTNHARIGCPACHDSAARHHEPPGGISEKTECRACHADILAEYGASGHAGKATCTGCHDPHVVKSPMEISGQEVNRMCASCHDGYRMMSLHSDWLPQADLHLEMLPCVTCHTGSKNYVTTLYIVKGKSRYGKQTLASHEELRKLAGGGPIVGLVDINGDGYVSLAELRLFNTTHQQEKLRLKGMLTPERTTHTYQILENRRDCTFCHGSGPGMMQTSRLALPTADGNLEQVKVETGAVLDALYATPDFYMTGATRNGTLNLLGGGIIAAGLIMPVGHGFLRLLTRKNREKGGRS